MNGGVYMDSTAAVTMNRLGVEQITLPTPERTGYIFKGWKSPNGKLYNGTLTNVLMKNYLKIQHLRQIGQKLKQKVFH